MLLILLIIFNLIAQDCKELSYYDPISIPFNDVKRLKISDYVCDTKHCYQVSGIYDGIIYQGIEECGYLVDNTLVDYQGFICDGHTNTDFGYKCEFSISLSVTKCVSANDIYNNY